MGDLDWSILRSNGPVQALVEAEQTMHRAERWHRRVGVDFGQARLQLDGVHPKPGAAERSLKRRRGEPQRRIPADNRDRFHTPAHTRASASWRNASLACWALA